MTREFLVGMEQIAILVENRNMMKLLRSVRKEFRLGTMSDSKDVTIDNDYKDLENSLKLGAWKEADAITTNIILKLIKRQRQGQLDFDSTMNIPCTDLHTINNLWAYYSNTNFGFGTQKSIWDEIAKQANNTEETYNIFCQRIGWFDKDNQLLPIQHKKNAPKGHLPSGRIGNIALFLQVGQRLGMPNVTLKKTVNLVRRFNSCLISSDPTGQPDGWD